MFMAFVMFFAMYLIAGVLLRLLQTKFSDTAFGAALAYIHG